MTEPPSTELERARQRSKLVRLALVVGGLDRVVGTVSALVRVGLLAYLLSNRDYGLYVAVLGVVASANLLDFGVHYGVVGAVSQAAGRDDWARMRALLSTAACVYSGIAGVALVVLIPVLAFGPVAWLFGLQPDQVVQARLIGLIGFSSLLLSLPTKVASAGLMGIQLSYVVSAYRSFSSILQTSVLAAVALLWRGQVLPVAVVSSVMDLANGVLLTIWATSRYRDQLGLSLRAFDKHLVRPLLSTGLTFFFSNLANLLRRSLVTVAIAHSLGTFAVPRFSVPFALFTTGLAFTEIAGSSLWPAYGEAAARKDWPWIGRAFRLSTRMAFFIAFGIATLGVVSGDEVLRIWTVKIPPPSVVVLAWLALWMVSQAATTAAASLLNGLGMNRLVMNVVLAEGALTFGSVALLVRFFGIEGSSAAMAVSGCVGAVFLLGVAVPKATLGRVRSELAATPILFAIATPAAVAGLLVEARFSAAPVRLAAGAIVAATIYGACAWTFVLTPAERARLRRKRQPQADGGV